IYDSGVPLDSEVRSGRQHRRQANFGIGTLAMFSTPIGYKLIASDLTAALQRTSEQPVVQRESEYYLETIKNIKSIDEFISNDRVFKYAMKAFGLEDMNYAKAFMRKVLTEGIDDPQSFANKLSDPKYR